MRYALENKWVMAEVDKKGAELKSLYSKERQKEYLWQGDEEYWGRTSPVLFPIVGRLKEDRYTVENQTYSMTQHGFARDREFDLVEESNHQLTFQLTADSESLEMYPYDFELRITYTLHEKQLNITYYIRNLTDRTMHFSIGGHPGFQVPMTEETQFEDYVVSIQPEGERERIPLEGAFADIENGVQDKEIGKGLPLAYSLFDRDALIYKMEGRSDLIIHSKAHEHYVKVSFEDFPFLGIWTPPSKNAPFLCIEPWHGIADTIDATGELPQKAGIQSLDPNELFQTTYTIEID